MSVIHTRHKIWCRRLSGLQAHFCIARESSKQTWLTGILRHNVMRSHAVCLPGAIVAGSTGSADGFGLEHGRCYIAHFRSRIANNPSAATSVTKGFGWFRGLVESDSTAVDRTALPERKPQSLSRRWVSRLSRCLPTTASIWICSRTSWASNLWQPDDDATLQGRLKVSCLFNDPDSTE